MSRPMPSWEMYERLIARMMADQLSTDYCVTPNARIRGRISHRSRQIDVLIESRHDTDSARRIIVDAKNRTRKINISDIEAFQGLMLDVGATHGYLISPNGHTKSAEKRAQEKVSIRIVSLDNLDNFDPSTWPKCTNSNCTRGRIFWDGYPSIEMTTSSLSNQEQRKINFIHHVGKCDCCGRFHVKCLTCGDLLSPLEDKDDDHGHQCSCKLPWFWLASIEEDDQGHKFAELHTVFGIGRFITVNRRGL